MPYGKFISAGVAKKRLLAAGFKPIDLGGLLDGPRGIKEHHLKVIESSAKAINPKSVMGLLDFGLISTAVRQLKKKRFSELGMRRKAWFGLKSRANFFLESFTPHLSKIIKNQALEKKGYETSLIPAIDMPFTTAIRIEKNGVKVGYFNFEMFFNKQLKPSVMLGHFQGGLQKQVQEFRESTGQSPLDFLLNSFRSAFPNKNQLIALNPRKHGYRTHNNLLPLAASMQVGES